MNAAPMFKFDNIFNGMIASYMLANTEGWTDIINQYVKFYNI
jgi:hypothetical protein